MGFRWLSDRDERPRNLSVVAFNGRVTCPLLLSMAAQPVRFGSGIVRFLATT
jgi:hypothetical protein